MTSQPLQQIFSLFETVEQNQSSDLLTTHQHLQLITQQPQPPTQQHNSNMGTICWLYISPIILLIGVLGNMLVIVVVARKQYQKTTTQIYLSFLAFFDSMALVTRIIPEFVKFFTFFFSSNLVICKTEDFLFYLSSDVAIWTLVAFTIDRVLAVKIPLKRKLICRLQVSRRVMLFLVFLATLKNMHVFWTRGFNPHLKNQFDSVVSINGSHYNSTYNINNDKIDEKGSFSVKINRNKSNEINSDKIENLFSAKTHNDKRENRSHNRKELRDFYGSDIKYTSLILSGHADDFIDPINNSSISTAINTTLIIWLPDSNETKMLEENETTHTPLHMTSNNNEDIKQLQCERLYEHAYFEEKIRPVLAFVCVTLIPTFFIIVSNVIIVATLSSHFKKSNPITVSKTVSKTPYEPSRRRHTTCEIEEEILETSKNFEQNTFGNLFAYACDTTNRPTHSISTLLVSSNKTVIKIIPPTPNSPITSFFPKIPIEKQNKSNIFSAQKNFERISTNEQESAHKIIDNDQDANDNSDDSACTSKNSPIQQSVQKKRLNKKTTKFKNMSTKLNLKSHSSLYSLSKTNDASKSSLSSRTSIQDSFKRHTLTSTTFMCLGVSVAFVVCVAPSIILTVGKKHWLHKSPHHYNLFKNISNQLSLVNHASSFFLYCLTGQKFRIELKNIFKGLVCSGHRVKKS